jgi:tetratricopeptide (TPR) repeat protein
MSASFELARRRVGEALSFGREACTRATRKTGGLAFRVLARVLDEQRDRSGRVDALARALEFEPNDIVLRHQYGVALSRSGRVAEALTVFERIISEEKEMTPYRQQLLYTLKAKCITLRKANRDAEARETMEWAKQVIADVPHLRSQEEHFVGSGEVLESSDPQT